MFHLCTNRFEEAKKKIEQKYDEIERTLIEQFVQAQESNSLQKMKEIASILSHFKGYSQCVDAFIEESQKVNFLKIILLFLYVPFLHEFFVYLQGALSSRDVFNEVIPMCEKNFKTISCVFNNPEQINAKFVLNIYHLKLQVKFSIFLDKCPLFSVVTSH